MAARRHFTVPAFRSATIPSTTTTIAVLRSGRYPSRPCRRFRCRWGDDPCRDGQPGGFGQGYIGFEPYQRFDAPAAGSPAHGTGRRDVGGDDRRPGRVHAPRSSGAQVAGRPAGAGCVYRAVVRRETRRPRLGDAAAHRSDGHPANDGRAVPVGEPHVVLSRAPGSPSVSSAAACTSYCARRSKCPTTRCAADGARSAAATLRKADALPSLPTVRSP